eukprot:CCRYP_003774-RA/>CCRYP_003774-RA protein AED:0.45 eAED:0.83 QI:0/-1/0/1/-1/0/1/0/135
MPSNTSTPHRNMVFPSIPWQQPLSRPLTIFLITTTKRHTLTQLHPYHPLPPATTSQHSVKHAGAVNFAMLSLTGHPWTSSNSDHFLVTLSAVPGGQLPGRQFAKTKQQTAPVLQESMPLTNASTTYYPSNMMPLT